MNVYRISLEQWTYYTYWEKTRATEVNVRASTAQQAIQRALSDARRDGYLKSRPIDVVSVQRIAVDLLG